MMVRAFVIAALAVLSVIVCPQRVEAQDDLWSWLKELSGPGPFRGAQFDVRFACLGSIPKEEGNVEADVVARRKEVAKGDYGISTGVLYSACTGARSSAPITLGVSFRHLTYTDPTGEYAGGNEIGLTTLGIAAMWRPIDGAEHPKLDFVDIGVAVNRYWFTSGGSRPGSFQQFSGLMIEPIRVELHWPSAVRNSKEWWWVSIPFVQLTAVVFPAGFAPNAFGPNLVGPKAERIPAEWTRAGNFFFDLTPIVERLARLNRR